MTFEANWIELDEVGSTQEIASRLVARDSRETSVVFAQNQVAGRGRFGRQWFSEPGASLTMTLLFWDRADWQRPWLIGMAVALAAADAIDCQVRWPNDLAFGELKVGGILTELFSGPKRGRVPAVGVGINLLQREFPSDLPFATSVLASTGKAISAHDLAQSVVSNLQRVPEPNAWEDLAAEWASRDRTPGKAYKLLDGREAVALAVTGEGALRCLVEGSEEVVFAADGWFGSQ